MDSNHDHDKQAHAIIGCKNRCTEIFGCAMGNYKPFISMQLS